jgi:hypothetical protein
LTPPWVFRGRDILSGLAGPRRLAIPGRCSPRPASTTPEGSHPRTLTRDFADGSPAAAAIMHRLGSQRSHCVGPRASRSSGIRLGGRTHADLWFSNELGDRTRHRSRLRHGPRFGVISFRQSTTLSPRGGPWWAAIHCPLAFFLVEFGGSTTRGGSPQSSRRSARGPRRDFAITVRGGG